MATMVADELAYGGSNPTPGAINTHEDPFVGNDGTPNQHPYVHRYSSRFDLIASSPGATTSPSQVKRVLEAHLFETERRLQDTQKLGTSLLDQQARLQDKIREVEQQQDEAEVTPELRQQLEDISREHDEAGKELARSLIAPKLRAGNSDDDSATESSTYTSQATGSPTKISAPNRRQRNQPNNRAGDLQFAADISTSLLAQVRQLQAAVAERDEMMKNANTGRLKLEQDIQGFTQRIRDLQEHEQRYKDENWNLETQNHELLSTTRDATDKERRLNASLSVALAEKSRLQSEMEEIRLAHGQLNEEHSAARKAHETELHSLKRDVDAADSDRSTMQTKIEELAAQNAELARAMASKYRNISPHDLPDLEGDGDDLDKGLETPEHSPPPSPTKATPRHGGLESETLRSSLHHAHRMIQNLKGNIHREKTEKIELKRMLQDARDELEQRRSDTGVSGSNKRQKPRNEVFKKPLRPDQLGGSRQARTDVEVDDEDWEDHTPNIPGGFIRHPGMGERGLTGMTDMSDAYQTAHESSFETADERHATESEAFETGAESLAGDSMDDLTETEDTVPRTQRSNPARVPRGSLAFKNGGNRTSYLSTASTSAGEDDEVQTPIQAQHRFRLRNGRSSIAQQSTIPYEGTPESLRSSTTAQDSPATVTNGRSPPAAEQSLFAELGGFDDASSDRFGTPARSSTVAEDSTPNHLYTPSRAPVMAALANPAAKPVMVDSAMMTEPWQSEPTVHSAVTTTAPVLASLSTPTALRAPSPSDFPLPPSVPVSPVNNHDMSTQYTPQRVFQESPLRNNATFITPPKTIWDEASEAGSPMRDITPSHETPKAPLSYSGMLAQDISPVSPAQPTASARSLAYSGILSQQTQPTSPAANKTLPVVSHADETTNQMEHPKTAQNVAVGAIAGGLLATAASALGFSRASDKQIPVVDEDRTSGPTQSSEQPQGILQTVPANATPRSIVNSHGADSSSAGAPVQYSSNDQGAQTMLTADQIEQALKPKTSLAVAPLIIPDSTQKTALAPTMNPMSKSQDATNSAPRSPEIASSAPRSTSRFQEAFNPTVTALPPVPNMSPNRPPSASSYRTTSLTTQQHPPLPSNYRTNIAKANSGVPVQASGSKSAGPGTAAIMGPPLMPASAMRRPRTPAESIRSPTRDNATTRASQSGRHPRGTVSSQVSRRSSVSSFASELDERFNIRPGETPTGASGYEAGPGTDPRMIQAITQTMIGEYLWKYTRKTVGKDFSNTRHRRYFWIHPYTKTLYWSSHGPESGDKESTSKSVVIESVRVITDENPMPPGLHRKSLEVTTPGRKIRFTAATGQRHETWFNALSYLLLRGEPADQHGAYTTGGNEITRDDIDEFNAGAGYNAHLVPNTNRLSMSSYNSRTTRGTSTHRTSRQAMPSNVVATNTTISRADVRPSTAIEGTISPDPEAGRISRAGKSRDVDADRTIRAKSMSRISKIFGSTSGRTSQTGIADPSRGSVTPHGHRRHESDNSIYDASIVSGSRRNSAEEMRQEMLRQEALGLVHGQSGGLENVRACCDGKHDVSTLTHTHRHGDRHGTLSSVSERINRSVSRRA